MTKALPLAGTYDWPDFKLSIQDKKKLLDAVKLSAKQGAGFVSEIEDALKMAIVKRTLGVKRDDAKKALRRVADTAEEVLKVLREIPFAAQSYYNREGVPFREVERQMVDLVATATRATNRADQELGGKGNTKKRNHTFLAADIAIALKRIGIEPRAYRPRETEKPNVFWQVTEICIPLAGLASIVDLLPHLRDGLKLSKKIHE